MVESIKSLSKFAISNIFHFLDLKSAFKLRRVSKKFDAACLIGLKMTAEYELTDTIDYCRYIIDRDFSKEN